MSARRPALSLFSLAFVVFAACTGADTGAPAKATAPAASASAGAPVGGAGSGSDPAAGGTGAVAVVAGQEITWEELDRKAAGRLIRLRSQAYDTRRQVLDQMIDERLVEAEAKSRGITAEALLKSDVSDKVTEPTEQEAREFWEANPRKGGGDFEQMKGKVIEFLKKKKEGEVRQAFFQSLRTKANVEVRLEPLRFDVTVDADDPRKGKADAPIQIVEFSDFQCPYCSRVLDTMKKVEETYGDKVSIVFRDYPLPMHPEAPKAGEAGQCANDQGKFWEMHDKMFANQHGLKDADLKKYAADLSLDTAAFDTCLDSGKYKDEVQGDKLAGDGVGVSGTPAFFINGRFLNGAVPFEQFKDAIDAELKAKGLL